jgi:tetratricopeptide (TPR) repeat protein
VKILSRNWPNRFTSSPNKPENLVGYADTLSSIVKFLLNRQGERVVISGPGGFGKTILAKSITADPEIENQFRDGVLWARPVDYMDETALLGAWAEILGSDISRVSSIEGRTSIVQNLLRERRVLLILDGVKDAQKVAALVCGGQRCATILTTRDEQLAQDFGGSSGIWRMEGLRIDQAIDFLSTQVPSMDWDNFLRGTKYSDDLRFSPLALRLIAGNLKVQQTLPLLDNNADPATAGKKNEGLLLPDLHFELTGEIDLRKLVGWSLGILPSRFREVYLNLLAFAPEPDGFSRQAAIQVTNAMEDDLEVLVACNLIKRENAQLSIPRAISESLSRQTLLESQKRHRQFYLDYLISQYGQPAKISEIYGQCMYTCSLKKVEENRREIVNALSDFQEEFGLWEDYRICAELALQACKSHSLCQEEGRLCNNLGRATHMLGDVQVAINYYRLAEDLLGKDGELVERALVMNNIASLLVEKGELEEAQTELLRAIPLLEDEIGSTIPAYLHNNLGKIYDDLSLPILARDEYIKALSVLDGMLDEELELTVRFNLSLAYQALGNKIGSIDELQKAVEIEEKIGHPNYANDLNLLDKLRGELNEPKIVQWIRRRFLN